MNKNNKKILFAFTLVELLIVIAILAILAAAVVIVINPGEMMAEARDAERISSIESLKKSIDLFVLDNPGVSLGTSQVISISIPDTSGTCTNITGLPTLPTGWSYRCVIAANLKNIDSTGWLPINLTLIKGGSPIPYLPIDPQNDQTATKYYQYIPGSTSGSYELTTLMESEKQAKIAGKDGGIDPGRLETGSNVSLWKTASGLSIYWGMNEGSGSSVSDLSGNGNAGNITGGYSWVPGVNGSAISFDGVSGSLAAITGNPLLNGKNFTIYGWFKPNPNGKYQFLWHKRRPNLLITPSANVFGFELEDAGGAKSVSISTSISNKWYFLAEVLQGSRFTCYVFDQNGLVGTGERNDLGAIVLSDGNTFNVSQTGWWGGGEDSPYRGLADEVAVYTRALSVSEIRAIYNATK